MANPDRLSEFAKLYYQIGDYDITDPDATILADAGWKEMCIISLSPSSNINSYEVKDRCVGEIVGNTPGRESFTFDLSMYMFRQDQFSTLKSWHTAMDSRSIVSFMALNDDRTATDVWGFIGNFIRIDESQDEPEEGLIQLNYTFGPAARSAFSPLKRRIYGAGAGTFVAPVIDPLDLTATAGVANIADLSALKSDGTNGDGNYSGNAFTTGQYVILKDGSKAHYANNAWASGAAS